MTACTQSTSRVVPNFQLWLNGNKLLHLTLKKKNGKLMLCEKGEREGWGEENDYTIPQTPVRRKNEGKG